jgi:hypothetical protein
MLLLKPTLAELVLTVAFLVAAHLCAATNALAPAECAAATCRRSQQQQQQWWWWLGRLYVCRISSCPHILTRRPRLQASWHANTAA